jgi:3-phytase
LKYNKAETGYKVAAEYAYHIDAYSTQVMPKEVFRGVSEILAVSENKILVMERGVRISPKKIFTNTVGIYLTDLSKATDISANQKLDRAKAVPATKTKLIDFETDLPKDRSGKDVDNLEGLAWGPNLPDGRKTLLVISDDNFNKTQITQLFVFAVDGE